MILKKAFLIIISIFIMVSCRITQERVSGKYVDKTYNDSLKLNKDGSYVHIETLKSGALGQTGGHWKLEKKQVEFTNNKTAYIGYRLEVNRAGIAEEGDLKFLLANSEKPLAIKEIKISTNGQIISSENSIQTNKLVKIPDQYDFMVINTHNFPNILIKDTLQSNYQYEVRVFPIERLYELDKIPFKIRGRKLKGTQRTQYDDGLIKFKKIRKYFSLP